MSHPKACSFLLAASTLLLPAPPAAASTPDEVLVVAPGASVEVTPGDAGETAEAAVGGGLLRPLAAGIAAPAEAGDRWLAVASRDGAGNVSEVRWIWLRVDGVPPAVDLTFEPAPVAGADGRWWLAPGGVARAAASDQPAGVATTAVAAGERVEEAAGERAELPLAAVAAHGGEEAIRAWAVDRVGNRAAEVARPVWIDGAPPQAEIVVAGPHIALHVGLVAAPATAFAVRADDAGSGVAQVLLNADGVEVGEDGWEGPWTAGAHALAAEVFDRVGNRASLGSLAFTVDAEPPEVRWQVTAARSVEAGGVTVYRPPVAVTVVAEDLLAGVDAVEWSADGESWSAVAGRLETSGDRVRLRARDRVGNLREVGASWRIDGAPPRLALIAPGGERVLPGGRVRLVSDGQVEVVGEDDGSGLGPALQAIDGGTRQPLPPLPGLIRFRIPGSYRLEITAEDRLGNAATGEWTVEVVTGGGDGE